MGSPFDFANGSAVYNNWIANGMDNFAVGSSASQSPHTPGNGHSRGYVKDASKAEGRLTEPMSKVEQPSSTSEHQRNLNPVNKEQQRGRSHLNKLSRVEQGIPQAVPKLDIASSHVRTTTYHDLPEPPHYYALYDEDEE